MGFLSSLFGGGKDKKEDKKEAPSKPEHKMISLPLGDFYYTDSPDSIPPEFGYEGEIEWFDTDDEDERMLGVYFDRDTPDSDTADICYKKLAEYVSDKAGTERKAYRAVAEHFFNERPDLIRKYADSEPKESAEELADDMKLHFISIYRNGDTVFSVYHGFNLDIPEDDLRVTFKADGSTSFEYTQY